MIRPVLAALVLLATIASSGPAHAHREIAAARFDLPRLPLFPGSRLPISVEGMQPPYDLGVVGGGAILDSLLDLGEGAGDSTIVAANRDAVAARTLHVVAPPDPSQGFIAVASYDDGVVIHEASAPYAIRGALAIGGAPADVAIDPGRGFAAATTDALSVSIATFAPWHVAHVSPVQFADELAFGRDGTLFVTNRDVNGAGALTRVAPDGTLKQRILGLTAEGLAIDDSRQRVYVANVNDGTVSIVDTRSLVELQRIRAVDRVFSLALSPDGATLYGVSNQSVTSPFGHAGSVVAIDVRAKKPRVVKRSPPLTFPVGAALDAANRRLFVTDEHDNVVYVLDARTLRAAHAPLHTCLTPWKPLVDDGRLYVPCARANEIDVFDAKTLRRVAGAPFRTGGYPLAVAVWHPEANAKHSTP